MSTSFQDWKEQVVNLPPQERAELAYVLLSSLGPDDEDAEAAADAEASRRVEEICSGRARGIPADELIAELREQYP